VQRTVGPQKRNRRPDHRTGKALLTGLFTLTVASMSILAMSEAR
jgi:hypothetical protein